MNKQQGSVGNLQVLNSMKAAVTQQRAVGTVPVAWVDSWIAQLEVDYATPLSTYPLYSPFRPYSFVDFHPLDTFMPLFASNSRVTFTSTVK